MKKSLLTLLVTILMFQVSYTQTMVYSYQKQPKFLKAKSSTYSIIQRIKQATSLEALKNSIEANPVDLSNADLAIVKMAIWEKYQVEETQNTQRQKEHQHKAIEYNGKTMKYEYQTVGEMPKNGYPLYIALHGGGGAPAKVNDSQWEAMKRYYLNSIDHGVYVAPRGMTDTWNLHFVGEAYPSYDRLIENMILFENVDPNKVYFLGYSAGGDGVYQVVPRMADRFAAANMSAGHPNGVNLTNVYHVPFLIQVGELDKFYDRNKISVEYGEKLAALQAATKDGYIHDTYVHWEKEHSYAKDHSGANSTSEIIANPSEWRIDPTKKIKTTKNTDAITWMSNFTRNPLPNKIIWDYQTKDKNRSGVMSDGTTLFSKTTRPNTFYWIACFEEDKALDAPIKAAYDKAANRIDITSMGTELTILVNEQMVDFDSAIHVNVEGQTTTRKVVVKPNLSTMIETLQERGDYNYIFMGSIKVKKTATKDVSISAN